MKRYAIIGLFLAMSIACNNENRQIEKAADGYLMAVSLYDIDGAEAYCTEETQETTLKTARQLLQMVDSAFFEQDKPVKIDIMSVHCTSDTTATVQYHKTTPIKDFADTLEMRKRDGKWLAHSPMIKNNVAAQ